MSIKIPADIIGKLREAVIGMEKSAIYKDIVEPQDAVFARFQPVFAKKNVQKISEEEFRSFLLLENNHHWTGLQRHGPRMCADIVKLRKALSILVNEELELMSRLDKSIDMVSGLGKNLATAILLVIQPEKHGVWNSRSEENLKRLDIWPNFEHGESFGSRYIKVNEILLQLRDALDVDLWALDALWWYLDQKERADTSAADDSFQVDETGNQQSFGLERHLHEFLRDNWNHLELSKDWNLYQEPGDEEAGFEYPCEVGRIDLLARHKRKPHWLVIELKRNQTSDQTVGQLLRYVGWVKQKLAQKGEEVHGMIICRQADSSLKYALSMISNVELRYYEVEFHLRKPTIEVVQGDE